MSAFTRAYSDFDSAFIDKAVRVARSNGLDPWHLLAAMSFETGGTFSPSIRSGTRADGSGGNPNGAVGLIQFTGTAAEVVGIPKSEIAQMSAMEQLDVVDTYFARTLAWAGPARTLSDVYMAIIAPARVGDAEGSTMYSHPSTNYRANEGLDLNGDGRITKSEAAAKVRAKLRGGGGAGPSMAAADYPPRSDSPTPGNAGWGGVPLRHPGDEPFYASNDGGGVFNNFTGGGAGGFDLFSGIDFFEDLGLDFEGGGSAAGGESGSASGSASGSFGGGGVGNGPRAVSDGGGIQFDTVLPVIGSGGGGFSGGPAPGGGGDKYLPFVATAGVIGIGALLLFTE